MGDAVLLEWEGVLADTRAARRDALRHALAAEGIAHTLSDDDEQLRGLGVSAAVRVVMRHMGCTDAALGDLLAVRASRAFAETLARGIVLAPGAASFVERMQLRRRIAVVTRASRAETEEMLRLSGFQDAVTTVVCADDVADATPATESYRVALARLSRTAPLGAHRAVAVVDGAPSIRAARRAGARVVVVGAPPHEAIEADAAVESLADLDGDAWFAADRTPDTRHAP